MKVILTREEVEAIVLERLEAEMEAGLNKVVFDFFGQNFAEVTYDEEVEKKQLEEDKEVVAGLNERVLDLFRGPPPGMGLEPNTTPSAGPEPL